LKNRKVLPPPPLPLKPGHGDDFSHISFNTQTQSIEKHKTKQWNVEQNYQTHGAPGGNYYYEKDLMEGLHQNRVLEFTLRARDLEVRRLNELETDVWEKANLNQTIWEELENVKKKEKANAKAFAEMKATNASIGTLNLAIHQEMEELTKTMRRVKNINRT